jgi:arabinose-5-phosphate isomerase
MNKDVKQYAKSSLNKASRALDDFATSIGDEFVELVDLIRDCQGKVFFCGMGKSGIVGKKIASTFSSIGISSVFLSPADAGHGDLGALSSDDICIFISHSGNTEEILSLFSTIKDKLGVYTVAITGNSESFLAKKSDLHVCTGVMQEGDPLGIVPTVSSTVSMAIGDAIAVCLMHLKDLKKEEFALYHPGGVLGKQLLLSVDDLMSEAGELKKIDSFHEVLNTITSYRKGATTVVNDNGELEGIITDGDLRRTIERLGKEAFDVTAEEMMNAEPKFVKTGDRAIDVLTFMETEKISFLPILEGEKLIGCIHIHDLLKEGLK